MSDSIGEEHRRILEVYNARQERQMVSYFEFNYPAHLSRLFERYWFTLRLLRDYGYHPLTDLSILDIGCGDGNMLRQFIQWGANPNNVAGVELRPDPVQKAKYLSPNLDVRLGTAVELPWPNASFDLVCQHTVFTSILDPLMRKQVALEMIRALQPGGAILWYDFQFDNPYNPDVRGVKRAEIRALFPGLEAHLRRITLAPPLARHLPEFSLPVLYPLLSSVPLLCTHYLGLLIKPSIKTTGSKQQAS